MIMEVRIALIIRFPGEAERNSTMGTWISTGI